MGRKLKLPKELRKKNKTKSSRLGVPFQNMSDDDIINHFIGNVMFLKRYIAYTKQDYETVKGLLRESISYVKNTEREDFAQYIKVCREAFQDPNTDKRQFYDYIITYLQDVQRSAVSQASFIQSLEEKHKESSYWHWVFPSTIGNNTSNPFHYDFAYDFFLGNLTSEELKSKYSLDHPMYIRMLKTLQVQGIIPEPL